MKPKTVVELAICCASVCWNQIGTADQLEVFLQEFAKIPVGISEQELKQRFPDVVADGAANAQVAYYTRKVDGAPFREVVFQFQGGCLFAALAEMQGDDTIVRWAKPTMEAMERTWGKPDSRPASNIDRVHLSWTRADSKIDLSYAAPAVLLQPAEKGESPNGHFIFSIQRWVRDTVVSSGNVRSNRTDAVNIPAEEPTLLEPQEFPTGLRGEFLVTMEGPDGKVERLSAPKPFGTIGAKEVVLANGDILRVSKIYQLKFPVLGGTQISTGVFFENRGFFWSILPEVNRSKIVSFEGTQDVLSPTGGLTISQAVTGQMGKVMFRMVLKRNTETSNPVTGASPGR